MDSKSNNLIIFDLDETLIHSVTEELNYPASFTFDKYFVYERPMVQSFLHDIACHFPIGIWSSAGEIYVQEIINKIMPATVEPVIVWGRNKCSFRHDFLKDTYIYEKRLDKLKKKGYRMKQILIVDDLPENARANYGNAIYIKEFTGDPNDCELRFLYNYLLTFKNIDNVRNIEKRGWRR